MFRFFLEIWWNIMRYHEIYLAYLICPKRISYTKNAVPVPAMNFRHRLTEAALRFSGFLLHRFSLNSLPTASTIREVVETMCFSRKSHAKYWVIKRVDENGLGINKKGRWWRWHTRKSFDMNPYETLTWLPVQEWNWIGWIGLGTSWWINPFICRG